MSYNVNNKVGIMGVKLSIIKPAAVLAAIRSFLNGSCPGFINTVNPEFILTAAKDEEFFYILNQADLNIPDGVGLKFAALAMGQNLFRSTGADLLVDILKIGENTKKRTVIYVWHHGLSAVDRVSAAVHRLCPGLEFMVMPINRLGEDVDWEKITDFNAALHIVALGAPYQEKFIFHRLLSRPYTRLAIGVGGAVDFLTGQTKRAPKIIRSIGFEWLWRVISQRGGKRRWRLKRIYRAVVIFTLKFIKWRFINPFLYRPSVACWLYKKVNNQYKVLIVERQDQKGHWQIPQGGLESETVKTAGEREIREELNTDCFKLQAIFRNIYRYKFSTEFSQGQSRWGFKGQRQSLAIAEYTGKERGIKVNYWTHRDWQWVDCDKLNGRVHQFRKKAYTIYLEKFNNFINSYEK